MGEPKPVMIDGDLLNEAEEVGLDIKEVIETEVRRRIVARRGTSPETGSDRAFVESYNRHIEEHGPAGEEHRRYG